MHCNIVKDKANNIKTRVKEQETKRTTFQVLQFWRQYKIRRNTIRWIFVKFNDDILISFTINLPL